MAIADTHFLGCMIDGNCRYTFLQHEEIHIESVVSNMFIGTSHAA